MHARTDARTLTHPHTVRAARFHCLPQVLNTFLHADRVLLAEYPHLASARVMVHFESHVEVGDAGKGRGGGVVAVAVQQQRCDIGGGAGAGHGGKGRRRLKQQIARAVRFQAGVTAAGHVRMGML